MGAHFSMKGLSQFLSSCFIFIEKEKKIGDEKEIKNNKEDTNGQRTKGNHTI